MGKYRKLSHSVYYCDYHIVWVPKYRFRILETGDVKETLKEQIDMISEWMGCEVKEKGIKSDHVHILVSIPPRISVSEYMGTLKGKLAIKLMKRYPGIKKQRFWGNHFWARGYFVSTVGMSEEMIKKYVKHQEKEEKTEEAANKNFTLFERENL
jgi:putative transposase